ncbi:hypothetical protein E3N88_08994 [Mikania micrantha]|uniref:DUF4218 domain-containing protein n=1 Tax=Mikania micrantha TaxID=192012 RepID=A0A5N6PIT2_9ASTR|nr:hypothetical protein E3N88_08994 [Mikania micrantha]
MSSINSQNDDIHINNSNFVDDDDNSIDLNDNLSEMLHDVETNIGDDDQRKLHVLFDDAENHYILEFEKEHKCVICGASRCKRKKETDDMDDDVTKNGPPNKILWYFPIIPRLKRLFSNENESKLLRWHKDGRVNDGKLRHVADSPQWRNIDHKYPNFGEKIRYIRFGLSSDGINPFGIVVYDAYKKENFTLRAMIFCTISDFSAYGNLSGYSTKGKKACPVCEDETNSIWLKNCKKTVYMGHRRFLPTSHVYRKKKDEFDGNTEHRTMRKRFDAFSRVENLNVVLGKRTRAQKDVIWKKKSIFWDLPYWKHLDVRLCLDVMHIEKTVCDSLLGLLLNIPGKTKDGINVRKDMVDMGIRKELGPVETTNRTYLPSACNTLSKEEKMKFCKCLHAIKVPSNYSANIKRLVSIQDCKLLGMKSHDCHVLMTHMIPIAIRGILPEKIRHTITKLCLFFNMIHSKVIDPESLDTWQKEVIITLCELKMYFSPSFFDVMVHLVSHIIGEIKACGPVFLRYMYPFERYTGFLKGYVRNRNRLEGSIVEGYASEEVIEFCTSYLEARIPDFSTVGHGCCCVGCSGGLYCGAVGVLRWDVGAGAAVYPAGAVYSVGVVGISVYGGSGGGGGIAVAVEAQEGGGAAAGVLRWQWRWRQ